MDRDEITSYLQHLSKVYDELNGDHLELAICGGAALNLLKFVKRVTRDIDVVSPEVLPPKFKDAIKITADHFGLRPDWINQGPIDLLSMGLPRGFFNRCEKMQFHDNLTYLIASRIDQIHFKLYAAIDRGGYHLQDLSALKPTDEELQKATKWCFTHDVSEPFRDAALDFLKKNGWANVAQKISR